ncbi:hypothetical protein [Streptomyces sp. SPB4]|uniref:hypothetical protein n=1 Tax=Streptomyces sp. SPB4 TaxID=2940553 RepID=UPI002476D6A6|nr:hypothetical protein [Streptomyces sp. SPB4]MDH6544206.1 hypothetical protein [Streptomyces sp. SPB4]
MQVLHGLGGCEKTATALRLARHARDLGQQVFWVSATTHERILAGMSQIARELGAPDDDLDHAWRGVPARWLSCGDIWTVCLDISLQLLDLLMHGQRGRAALALISRVPGLHMPAANGSSDQLRATWESGLLVIELRIISARLFMARRAFAQARKQLEPAGEAAASAAGGRAPRWTLPLWTAGYLCAQDRCAGPSRNHRPPPSVSTDMRRHRHWYARKPHCEQGSRGSRMGGWR